MRSLFIAAILLLTISLNTLADVVYPLNPRPTYNAGKDWIKFQSDSEGTRYAFLPSIQRNDDIVKLWIINDLQSPKDFGRSGSLYSTELQYELNCKEKQFRLLAHTWYAGSLGSGNALSINNRDIESPKWEANNPKNLGGGTPDALLNYVCGNDATQSTTEQPWQTKLEAMCAVQEFKSLFVKTACLADDIALEQLADDTKITKQQKPIFLKYRTRVEDLNKEIQEWRRMMGDSKKKLLADYVDSQQSEIDKFNLDLYKGAISWGTYNQRRKELATKMNAEFSKTVQH